MVQIFRLGKNFKKPPRNFVILGICVLIAAAALFYIFSSGKPTVPAGTGEFRIEAMYKEAAGYLDERNEKEAVRVYEGIVKKFPENPKKDVALLALGNFYKKTGSFEKSRKSYMELLSACPESLLLETAQKELGDLNIKMLFSPVITENSFMYEVKEGDTLSAIAKTYRTTVDLIKKSNNLSGDRIRIGQRLKVVKADFSVIVDKSQNTLTLRTDDEVIKVYRVSTGQNGCTPEGNFEIVNKLTDPTWYSTDAVVPPGSPENILGTRWMGLSVEGYGIHGTTEPETIGKRVTAGCVRMLNKDVEELYAILPRGTKVTVVD
jgi:lipoprotein-anchoring transpeptidase ErfK/SrfK